MSPGARREGAVFPCDHGGTADDLVALMDGVPVRKTKVKVKVKCSGALPNSSVTVIPTCPSQHPFRLAGSQTP